MAISVFPIYQRRKFNLRDICQGVIVLRDPKGAPMLPVLRVPEGETCRYQLPGGRMRREDNDSRYNCMRREAREQMGIEISASIYVDSAATKDDDVQVHYIGCEWQSGWPAAAPLNALPHIGGTFVFCSPEDALRRLGKSVPLPVRRFIAALADPNATRLPGSIQLVEGRSKSRTRPRS